jgi:AsmA protein
VKAHGRLGAIALEGTAEATGDRLTVSDADLTLDGNTLSGALIWSNIGTAKLEGSLAAPSLDLTPYVTALRPMVGSALGWSRRTLHALPALPETEIRLSADRISAGSLEFGNAAGSIRIRHGVLTLMVDELEAYGGSIAAHASYAPATDGGVHAGLSARIDNLALADALQGSAVRGTLTGTLKAEGTGPDTFDLIKALNGQAELRIVDGLVSGIDLAEAARTPRTEPLTVVAARGDTTPFTALDGHLALTDGIFQVETGKLAGDALTAELSGSIDLAERHWALSGTTLLVGEGTAVAPMPFRIEGPFGHPHFLPNGRRAVEHSGSAPAPNPAQ